MVPGLPQTQLNSGVSWLLRPVWLYWQPRTGHSHIEIVDGDPTRFDELRQDQCWQHAADVIRSVLAQVPAMEQELRHEACEVVAFLQSRHDARDVTLPTTRAPEAAAHAYDMLYLLQSLLLAAQLRSAESLQEVLGLALDILVPKSFVAELAGQIELWKSRLPSRTTISRHQLTLLSGWVLHSRVRDAGAQGRGPSTIADQDLESRAARFFLVDSSPQGLGLCDAECQWPSPKVQTFY